MQRKFRICEYFISALQRQQKQYFHALFRIHNKSEIKVVYATSIKLRPLFSAWIFFVSFSLQWYFISLLGPLWCVISNGQLFKNSDILVHGSPINFQFPNRFAVSKLLFAEKFFLPLFSHNFSVCETCCLRINLSIWYSSKVNKHNRRAIHTENSNSFHKLIDSGKWHCCGNQSIIFFIKKNFPSHLFNFAPPDCIVDQIFSANEAILLRVLRPSSQWSFVCTSKHTMYLLTQ